MGWVIVVVRSMDTCYLSNKYIPATMLDAGNKIPSMFLEISQSVGKKYNINVLIKTVLVIM